jgi:chromosome segregation ATPase
MKRSYEIPTELSPEQRREQLMDYARKAESRRLHVKEVLTQFRLDVKPTLDAKPSIDPPSDQESRLAALEAAFSQLASSSRLDSIEQALTDLRASVHDLGSRLHPLEAKYDVLRQDLKALQLTTDRHGDQIRSFDQIFASLSRDSHKIGTMVDGFATELKQLQTQAAAPAEPREDLQELQSRLSHAIALLQDSETSINEVNLLKERFEQMESRLEQIFSTVQSLSKPALEEDSKAEREATANVLASLTKLVQGMRAAQTQKPVTTSAGD